MSLECSECEHDLRGGHSTGCSRHPLSRRKPVIKLRKFLGDRDDHHANCESRRGNSCDCYSKSRQGAHMALDEILHWLDEDED